MSVNAPFTPTGNTVVITAANPSPTPVQISGNNGGSCQYRVLNAGSNTVFLGFGTTATAATAAAAGVATGLAEPIEQEQPAALAAVAQRQLSEDEQVTTGVSPDLIRLSIGVETIDDIIADLETGFAAAKVS